MGSAAPGPIGARALLAFPGVLAPQEVPSFPGATGGGGCWGEAEAAGRGAWEAADNRPSPESEESLDEEVDDVELALALGVPSNCVEKMSPRKVAVPDGSMDGQEVHPKEPSHTSGIAQPELSAAELRDLRIQELTFPDLI